MPSLFFGYVRFVYDVAETKMRSDMGPGCVSADTGVGVKKRERRSLLHLNCARLGLKMVSEIGITMAWLQNNFKILQLIALLKCPLFPQKQTFFRAA